MKFFYIIGMLYLAAFQVNAQDTAYSYQRPLFDFEIQKPVFELTEEQQTNRNRFLRFSVLTGYREGVEPTSGFANFAVYPDEKSGTRRFYMFNLSIQDMLTHGFYKSNRVILEVKDPSKYRYDSKYGSEIQWMRKNGYCFEFLLPAGAINGVKTLDEELSRVFKVTCSREKRMIKVLILYRTSKDDKIKSRGEGRSIYDLHGNFNNSPISNGRFGDALNLAGMPPVIDETNYGNPVDMDLNIKDWTNLNVVRKALRKYDLDLKEDNRELEVFIIKEIN